MLALCNEYSDVLMPCRNEASQASIKASLQSLSQGDSCN